LARAARSKIQDRFSIDGSAKKLLEFFIPTEK